ncbi:hypothetical protein NFI96_001547 [Prochilodus magdalenae]|nr:hypothetical protein NFI96_001547 [Prochilodus magdalenae]
MVINELRSYIESKKRILKNHTFRDSKLVIDGCNLYHTLYFTARLDQAHGGEYDAFEIEVSNFFGNLKQCNIKPYVVLTGEGDISAKMFDALKRQAEPKIRKAHALSRGTPRNVLPILIENVFVQLLRKLEVPLVQCAAKADWEAAALASEWNCPILSNNTDFYIFDIKGGFLPLYRFQWKKVASPKKSDKKYIPARLFLLDNLCGMNRMNRLLLPLFAILADDHPNLDKGLFPDWAQFSAGAEETRNVEGLLKWLSRFKGPVDAICALVESIANPDDSAVVIKTLTEGFQGYRLAPSSIAQFFVSGKPPSRLLDPLQSLPDWTLEPLAKGKLNFLITEVLAMQRNILNFPVEDFRLCSSNLTSQPIRQAIYGLVLCTRRETDSRHGTPDAEVEEYDRQGLRLTSSKVAAVLPSHSIQNLHLETLWETPWHLRLRMFLDVLDVSQVPHRLLVLSSLQLAVYVTCYWLKHAQPEPKPEFFWALLVGLVYGELSRDPITEKVLPQRLKNLKRGKEESPLDLQAAHAYSQWQCTLRDSICLSQLLANPVPEPEYARLFSGVLVHGVTRELKKGVAPESLLARAPGALEMYQQMKEAVEYEMDDEMRERFRASGERAERDLGTMLDHLMDKEEEGCDGDPLGRKEKSKGRKHDDEVYEQTCSIRTRHKSRSHKTNPRSKKYENSSWE